jgi:iron complex transport system substrate-binding protein
MEETMQGPAWQSIPAVRDKKVYYLPQELFLLSPGIHYPEAVAEMAKCVYPQAK